MSDDITKRLREGSDRFLSISRLPEVLHEAADEIERLRAELITAENTCSNWIKAAERMLPYVMKDPEFEGKFAPWVMTHFAKRAVRNEL